MGRPYALLRAGFPYLTTLGHRRLTNFPIDVAIGDEGRLYVLCRNDVGLVNIVRMNWDDEELGQIGSKGMDDEEFTWPVAIIRDREENLFVSDEALNRISMFTRDGAYLGKWGQRGDGDGQFNKPSGIAFDADENMLIADAMNHRIQKFTKDGQYLMKWGRYGDGDGEFNLPWGITVDDLGDVYVADWRNDRIQKFTADGEFIFKLGTSGRGNGQFNRPSGVAVDSDGDIYVADWGNDRVQQFAPTGRYVDKFLGDATLSKSGRAYIRANPRVLMLRESTTMEPAKRLRGPTSVRVDDKGRMYAVDYGTHRVQVYQKEAYPLGPDEIGEELKSPTLEM